MNRFSQLSPRLRNHPAWWSYVLAAGVIVGLTIALFGASLRGGRIFAIRDTAHFYYPLFRWCAEEWGAGRLPLWNPYEGIGSPVLADATSSVLYPGKLLFALPLPFDWLFQLYIVLHFLLAAAGTWKLAREQRQSIPAATMAAIAYAFGGSILFQYANVVFLVGAAWLPWSWIYLARLLQRPTLRDALALAAILALMVLGGDPQMVVHVALLVVIGWIVATLSHWKTETSTKPVATFGTVVNRWSTWMVGGAFLFAGLLSAVQILPSVVWAKQTTRAEFERPRSIYGISTKPNEAAAGILGVPVPKSHHERLYQFSIGPWRYLELFVPNGAGRPFPRHQRWLNYLPAEGALWVPSLYMGLLPVLLALGQLRFWRGNVWSRWLTWSATFFAVGSLGWYGGGWLVREVGATLFGYDTRGWFIGAPVGGIYWFLVTFIPGYVQFRYPAKLWTIVALALACLAARGLDATLRTRKSEQPRLWAWTCGLAVVAAIATPLVFEIAGNLAHTPADDPYFGPFQWEGSQKDVLRGFLQVALLCGLSWQLGKLLKKGHYRQLVVWGLVLLTAVDLAAANGWQIVSSDWQESPLDDKRDTAFITRFYRIANDRWDAPQMFQRTSSANRIEEIAYYEYRTSFGRYHLVHHLGAIRPYTTFLRSDYAQLLSQIDASLEGNERQRSEARDLLGTLGTTTVIVPLNLELNLPDTSVVTFDYSSYLLRNLSTRRAWTELPDTQISVIEERGGTLILDVNTEQSAELIVNVAFDFNWRATSKVADKSVPLTVERTQEVLCKMNIPAGRQRIEMHYDPPEFRWGAAISIVAWLLLLGGSFSLWLRDRRSRQSAIAKA